MFCAALLGGATVLGWAQNGAPVQADTPSQAPKPPAPVETAPAAEPAPAAAVDPLKRPLDEKKRKENARKLYKELGDTYKKWLDQDVRWIITDQEREAFLQLSNDEERDQFIEQFWLRRDPTPDTPENEYKEEHYRRIAYANEHFASGVPGWRTDRGRIYIMYGPPDEIDSHPTGGTYDRPPEEGGGTTSTFPFEDWRYRYLEGVGQDVKIEFVDTCMCNDYHMTMDRSEKDALLYVPGAGLTMWEQMGMANKADRLSQGGIERLGQGPFTGGSQNNEFNRLELYAKLMRPPVVKFKDLEEIVTHKINVNLMPFDVQTDFVKVTSDTVLVPITVQVKNKDVTFNTKDGVSHGTVNIFGRLTTLSGRIAQTFEDTVDVGVPAELLPKTLENSSVYWKAVPLRPGRYRLDLVVKDVNGDRVGTWSRGIIVPEYSDDRLASSSLILADQMEKVPTKNVGAGSFVIGDTKVRPHVADASGQAPVFDRTKFPKVNFWMQVYNLAVDQATHKPSAKFEYQIVNLADTAKPVVNLTETTQQMTNPGDQVTLEKTLPIGELKPGMYRITIKVADDISRQTITPSARFEVR
jgi:GWxTD domain-containing protein